MEKTEILTSQQVADMLGIKENTLFLYVQRKKITHYKVFKKVFFFYADVIEFIKSNKIQSI